jgi:hypothetical protein
VVVRGCVRGWPPGPRVLRLAARAGTRHNARVDARQDAGRLGLFPKGTRVARVVGIKRGVVMSRSVSPRVPTFSVAWTDGVWEVVDASDVRVLPLTVDPVAGVVGVR